MIPVFLYGDDIDSEFGRQISSEIGEFAGAIHINKKCICKYGSNAKYLVIESQRMPEIELKKGIVVIKQKVKRIKEIEIPEGFSAVVGSDNKAALKMLKRIDYPIITCGMSLRDTLSISSCTDNTISVSLQRSITLLNGALLEDCEIPIKFNQQIDEYSKLATVAILLLGGTIKPV